MRALSSIPIVRDDLINDGMVLKLLDAPIGLGSTKLRKLVRRALCRLVRGSEPASVEIGDALRKVGTSIFLLIKYTSHGARSI